MLQPPSWMLRTTFWSKDAQNWSKNYRLEPEANPRDASFYKFDRLANEDEQKKHAKIVRAGSLDLIDQKGTNRQEFSDLKGSTD